MIPTHLLLALALTFAGVDADVAKPSPISPAAWTLGSIVPTRSMLEPRSGHTATLLPDGRVLVTGGMRRNRDFYRSAELYDPKTDRFQATGNMEFERVGHVAVLLASGKVLIAGGWLNSGECADSAELYDPATGKFSSLGKMTARRGSPSATLLANGDVLITGGAYRDGRRSSLASSEIFRVATLSFQPAAAMHHPRLSHSATLLRDGRVLVAGGAGDSVEASAEIYDPKTGRFTETGRLATARYKHTAGLLPDGRVLVAGGSDERDWKGTLNSAEVYDPRTGKFTVTSPLNESRFKLPEDAVQLSSGKLLIAGGSRRAEVYDPGTGKFLLVPGQMAQEWHFMSATRLQDGRVLLAGGYPNNPDATSQAWLYKP